MNNGQPPPQLPIYFCDSAPRKWPVVLRVLVFYGVTQSNSFVGLLWFQEWENKKGGCLRHFNFMTTKANPIDIKERLKVNAIKHFREHWKRDFTPKLKRKPSEWATQARIIAAGTSPLADGHNIKYSHAVMPHCVEQMDSVDNPSVRMVVLWAPIRDGKTMSVCANIIGRTVEDSPGNIYSVHPVESDAARFSSGDVEPLIDSCLSQYFVEKKSRDAGRTIDFKKFRGGWLRIVNAGAVTVMRGTSVAVLLIHELDGILNPDAIFKAFGRTTGFRNAITVVESTGTLAAEIDPKTGKKIYRSQIEALYDQGDMRNWFCQCYSCGFLQRLWFDQIKYPKGKPQDAYYLCEKCDHAHDPHRWRRMAAGGMWFPTAALTPEQLKDIEHTHKLAKPIDPGIRSYWRNGANSLLPHHSSFASKLHEFAVKRDKAANGTKEEKKIWCQEMEAKLWSPETDGEAPPAWKPIYDRRENYGPAIPKKGLYLTAAVDCQLNRLEVEFKAWGFKEESWGMDHVTIDGGVRDGNTWRKLAVELSRRWAREDGAPMQLGMCLIDGGDYGEDVYHFLVMLAAVANEAHPSHLQAKEFFKGINLALLLQLYGHVRASKGFGKHGHPIIDRTMRTVSKNLKGHHIGTWEAKDRTYERLSLGLVEEAEGVMHHNERYTEEACQQLVSEQVTIVFEGNAEIRKYENPKRVRNETLDLAVGNLAAFKLTNHNLEALAEELNYAAKETKSPAREQTQQPQSQSAQPSGRSFALNGLNW